MVENIKLLRNLVLIKLDDKEQKTKGGIIIPTHHENVGYTTARVVTVGCGKLEGSKKIPLQVKKGDLVLLGKFKALEIEDHLLITDEDILGILE